MTIDQVLPHLHGVTEHGNGWIAKCPAHDDRTPSLSIAEGTDGKTLLKCHAGCDSKQVVDAMGLAWSDLFPVQGQYQSTPRSVATNPSPIPAGVVAEMHEVLTPAQRQILTGERCLTDEVIDRYRIGSTTKFGDPRAALPIQNVSGEFRDVRCWLHPERRTETSAKVLHWEKGYGGARLYPVDQLDQKRLVLVAGELDALALIAAGIPAITATAGESTWPDCLSAQIAQSTVEEVIIIPDNDDAGHKGAHKRAESLSKAGLTVRLAAWPEGRKKGWDATDELKAHGDDGIWSMLESADPYLTPAPDRPAILASAADLGDILDEAWSALEAYNTPVRLLRFGSSIVVVEETDGEVQTRRITADGLREELARAARWYSARKGENAYPPMTVARGLLAGDLSGLPSLSRIVRAPIMTPSGRIVSQDGYDEETKTWCVSGVDLPPVPVNPSEEQIRDARDLFTDDLLGDFPFLQQADRANILALYLLPFARELIDGPTPLHLIEKPSPGSGASLLLEVFGVLVSGAPQSFLTEASNEDEWRKRVTSTLLRAPEIIIIDNLRKRLDSAALSAALTVRTWEDRLLGSSDNVSLPVRCVWAATGNNPAVSNEIARRSVSVRIDPKVERPWERSEFRHPQLTAWTLENRGRLLQAALTLLRAWDVAGRPSGEATLGSYEQWAAVMGGILEVAGVEGFLQNRERFYDRADRESAAWGEFIAAWKSKHGAGEVRCKDLWEMLEDVDPPCDLGRGAERAQRIHLGDALAGAVDRRFTVDGQSVKIEAAGTKQRVAVYRLVTLEKCIS
jgi:putative DNA primase/helicase